MKKICFLTIEDTSGFEIDDELAIPYLNELGIEVDTLSWHSDEDWSRFDAAIVRTTWDYHKQPEAFVRKLSKIEKRTRLFNDLGTISWNVNKSYLKELEDQGIPIVDTLFEAGSINRSRFEDFQKRLGSEELIIKPTVSATAFNTFRLKEFSNDLTVFDEETYLVQPFVESVLEQGEYSLFYFNGEFSHAILKRPKAGDFRVQEDFGGIIEGIEAPQMLRGVARKVVEVFRKPLLYQRIDLIEVAANDFRLMELELIEPALYFRCVEGAAKNFAKAINKRLNEL